MLNAFKANASKEVKVKRRNVIKEVTLLCEEQTNLIDKQQFEADKKKTEVKARVMSVRPRDKRVGLHKSEISKFEIAEDKMMKINEMIVGRSTNKMCVSKKRSVFFEWRNAILQQRGFMYSIKNYIEKGLFHKGFMEIKEQSLVNRKERVI